MESSSPSVPFPLLQAPVESTYRACTIPYRFPSDNPRKATPVEIQWIDLFLNSVPSFKYAPGSWFDPISVPFSVPPPVPAHPMLRWLLQTAGGERPHRTRCARESGEVRAEVRVCSFHY
jgi:hypothetical protein